MEVSKIMIAHIATEVVVIGGITYIFSKKIADLNTRISELEKKLEKCEKEGKIPTEGITQEQFSHLHQQTTQHINNLYSVIQQIASSINREDNVHMIKNVERSQPKKPLVFHPNEIKKNIKPQHNVPIHSHPVQRPSTIHRIPIEPIIEEKEQIITPEDLDGELEDELKDLDNTDSGVDKSIIDITDKPNEKPTEKSESRFEQFENQFGFETKLNRFENESKYSHEENDIKESGITTLQELQLEFIPTKPKKTKTKK